MKHFKDMINLFSPLGYKPDQTSLFLDNGYGGRYLWKRSNAKAKCEHNDKAPSIVLVPNWFQGRTTYELEMTGELHGIWHKFKAYGISDDENLITNIQTAERALVAAWEAIAGVKASAQNI